MPKLISMLLLLMVSFCNSSKASPNDSLETGIDRIMLSYSGADRPGAIIGIIKAGQLVFQKGYGMADIDLQIENGIDVAYKLASVSKQFTAATIAHLIRNKRLALADDIRKYLPDFPYYGKPITVSDLLYHTSGIRDYMVLMWLSGKSFEDPFDNNDALQMIYRQSKLNFPTGHRCVYSNSNYILLAEIVQKVTGKSLAAYVHQELLNPLGMSCSGFNSYRLSKPTSEALSYESLDKGYRVFGNDNSTYGDGGMASTLYDLVIWDGLFYDNTSVTRELLTLGHLENGNVLSYGMGIMMGDYRGKQIQMHPGAFLGYRAEILRFPADRVSIVCLGNAEDLNPETITRKIADVYLFHDSIRMNSNFVQLTDAAAFIGKYEITPDIAVAIGVAEGKLFGRATGQTQQFLSLADKNKYKIGTTEDYAVFSDLKDGQFQELKIMQERGITTAKRPELVSQQEYQYYVGTYHCEEQQVDYVFYLQDGELWFRSGNNLRIKAAIQKRNRKIHFGYKNLEQAVITFEIGKQGIAERFVLETGRVKELIFVRK